MSEYERHKGKVRKVDLTYGIGVLTIVEFARLSLMKDEFCCEHLNDTETMEMFRDEYYEKYILVGEDLWEVIENEVMDNDHDFCEIDSVSKDTLAYHTSFYNGGTCLGEVLRYEIIKNEYQPS